MKLNKFFLAAFATIGLFASCVEDDPLSQEASLTIDGETTIDLDDSKAQTVSVSFRSNRDWTAKTSDKWIDVSPASGSASTSTQEIEITVLENKSYDRSGSVTLSIGTLSKTIKINQKGNAAAPDGTKENPFDVAAAIAKCIEAGETPTTEKYYVRGLISSIKSVDTSYGNAEYNLSDDGTAESAQFLVYRGYYLDGAKFTAADQIKVGDEVIVYCSLVNYKGNTPETNTGAPIVYLNGVWGNGSEAGGELTTEPKGTGTAEDPFNAAAAIQKCQEIGTTASTEQYYVKGIVSYIDELSTQFGNATFKISDDGTATDQFTIFRCKYIGGVNFTSEDQLKVGQEVVVKGALVNYYGNTPEMNQGCVLISIDGEGSGSNPDPEPVDPKGTGTAEDPFNASAAIQKCQEVGNVNSEEEYYVKGIISNGLSIDTSYGNANFYISDDGSTTSTQFYIFRCFFIGGEKFVATDQLKVGDEVVLKGKLINYNGITPEMTSGGQVISINGSAEVADYISISKTSAEVGSDAGSIELSVSSNTSWTVSSSDSFVTLSAASGEGNGTVTVSYTENTSSSARTATVTFTGAGKTLTFTLKQFEAGAATATELTWTKEEWTGADTDDISWTDGTYTIEVHKNAGSTKPGIYDNGIRAYAKATIVVKGPAFSEVTVVLASDGGFRYTTVTADSGQVGEQALGDKQFTWTGSATSVEFTVGDKATLGSDGETKAGQIRFNKIIVK
ncbi:MAG: BACON domain-containing protein [Candidatus Cryptobacteroides sp.]